MISECEKPFDESEKIVTPVEFDQMTKEMRQIGWTIALPIAFVIAATFLSCGGGIALIIAACRF